MRANANSFRILEELVNAFQKFPRTDENEKKRKKGEGGGGGKEKKERNESQVS